MEGLGGGGFSTGTESRLIFSKISFLFWNNCRFRKHVQSLLVEMAARLPRHRSAFVDEGKALAGDCELVRRLC